MPNEPPVTNPAVHIRWMILAAILAGVVPLLSRPTAELGFSDDWSYARMAFEVARTGTFHYDGWAAPASAPQVYWGALFVRMFGESYFVLRCSVLLLAAGSGALVYHLAHLCRLGPANSLLASLAVMLSPVSIPVSASFMTDVPGFFLAMLSIACAAHAITGQSAAARTAAFVLALIAALGGGWIRQVVWVILLCVIPIAIWLARPRGYWLITWILFWALALAAMAASMRWLSHQPYLVQEDLGRSLLTPLRSPFTAMLRCLRIGLTCALLLIPMIPVAWPALRRLHPVSWIIGALVAIVLLGGTVAARGLDRALDPWLGNIVTRFGCIEPGIDMIGSKPLLIPAAVNVVVALAAWLFLSMLVVLAACQIRTRAKALLARRLPPALYLLLAFSIPVLALSLVQAIVFFAFDRYLLPVLPLMAISLLMLRQQTVGNGSSVGSWLLVGLFAVVGVAFLHEAHETARARLNAIAVLDTARVPHTQISAGVEIDGMTQLAEWGYVNCPGIKLPADAYVPLEENPAWRAQRYWFWQYTPSIMPQYVVARSPVAGYEDARLGQLSYHSWFPPFRRPLYILKLIDRTQRPLRVVPGKKVPGDRIIRGADVSASEVK